MAKPNAPVYDLKQVGGLSVVTARQTADFFGLQSEYTLTVYSIEGFFGMCLEFVPEPAKSDGHYMVRIFDKSDGARRYVEQQIYLTRIRTWAMPFDRPDPDQEDVGYAREMAQNLIHQHDSVFENIRKRVRENLAQGFREKACSWLDGVYGDQARSFVVNALKGLHWRFLLQHINPSDEFINVLSTELENSMPAYSPMTYNGDIDIVPLNISEVGIQDKVQAERRRIAAIERKAHAEEARGRALKLMARVLGEEAVERFNRYYSILTQSNGYKFHIKERDFIECIDPNGAKARLCIHTHRLSCNPVDEVIIAYLNIKHCFDDYMSTAIYHSVDKGFQYPPCVKKRCA